MRNYGAHAKSSPWPLFVWPINSERVLHFCVCVCVRKIGQSSSFCLRKIVPELTSVAVFLYFICGTLPQHGLMSGVQVHAQGQNQQTLSHQSRAHKLNHYATGPAPKKRTSNFGVQFIYIFFCYLFFYYHI